MESGAGGVGRHGGARRLPTLRQEPLLPVSPPATLPSNRSNANARATTKERRSSSRHSQSSDRESGDDQGRTPSARRFGAGLDQGHEAGLDRGYGADLGQSNEAGHRGSVQPIKAHGSDKEEKTGRETGSVNGERRRNIGFDEARLDEMSSRGSTDARPQVVGREESLKSGRENELVGLRWSEDTAGVGRSEDPHERARIRKANRLKERVADRLAQQRAEAGTSGDNARDNDGFFVSGMSVGRNPVIGISDSLNPSSGTPIRGVSVSEDSVSDMPRQRQEAMSERSDAESSGASRKSRSERSPAEEKERRRRKEERRVKRAEKEARRAERAERADRAERTERGAERAERLVGEVGQEPENQEGGRGARPEVHGKRDRGTKDGRIRDRRQGVGSADESRRPERGLRIESGVSGENRVRESSAAQAGTTARTDETLDSRQAERIGPSSRNNGQLQMGEHGVERGENRRSDERGLSGYPQDGTEIAGFEDGSHARLGRSSSIMNEAYEEESNEAVLLHSALQYDAATGQLTSALAAGTRATAEEKKQRLYVEGGTNGSFLRTHTDSEQGDGARRWWRPRRDADEDDTEAGTSGDIVLRVAYETVAGCLALVAHFANSLLGGFALLNFYLTYLYNAGSLPGGFLTYYSPVAINCQRTFLVLTSICLLAACDKYAKDKLAEWKPRGSVQWRHDLLVILAMILAFVLSVVGTPFEYYVFHQNRTSPDWYSSVGSTAHFKARLRSWHVLNFVRLGACAVGFFLVILDVNTALRTARAQQSQAARAQRTAASAAVLPITAARGNTVTRIFPAMRLGTRYDNRL